MSKKTLCVGLAVAAILAMSGCGGSSSTQPSGMTRTPTVFGNVWSVAQSRNAQDAIAEAARNTPNGGSVTQSSNDDSGVTTDSVSVEVTRRTDGTVTYEVREADGWTVDRSTARVLERGTNQEEGWSWAEFHQAPDGSPGTGTGPGLYVDVYTDIAAPTTETVRTGGGDGARNVPIGTQLSSGNLNIITRMGGTSQLGTLDGAAGTFTCPSNCRISNGNLAEGSWTFTPDRPPGALDVPGNAAGVVLTGNFDTTRTDGTFNGAAGYFKCLSPFTTGCGRGTSNGRLTLSGDWIFVPTAAGTTTRTVQDADYLAGGIWVRVPTDATSVADYEFGAFVDGNDPFTQDNLAGLTGTATYSGEATAVYSVVSTGRNYFPDATATLTADFGDGAALGTIGGRIHDFTGEGPASGYDGVVVDLGSAAIGDADSGFFTGDVTTTGTDSPFTGKWGGQFYGNGAAATDPPGSVAGTFGAATADGGESFVGVFGADRE